MLRSAVAQQDPVSAPVVPMVESQLFQQVLDEVRQRREEFDAGSHVPRDMIERFKQVGIFAPPRRNASVVTPWHRCCSWK